jgi:hypothetical protein
MKPTTTVRKRTFMPSLNLAHIAVLVAVGSVAFALAPAGCVGGWDYSNVPEGDRCNPYDSHGECSSGLACTVSSYQVANQAGTSNLGTPELALAAGAGINTSGTYDVLEFCPENYCCPVDGDGNLAPSSNANCQPGCNGGAASICAAIGNTTAPYAGVCDFASSGMLPSEDGGTEEAGTPDSATPEAGTPDSATTPEAGTPDSATTPDAGDGSTE